MKQCPSTLVSPTTPLSMSMYASIAGAHFVEKNLKIEHTRQAYTSARNVAWMAL